MQHMAGVRSTVAFGTVALEAQASVSRRSDAIGADPRTGQDCVKLIESSGSVGFDRYDLETGLVSPSPGFCQIYGLDTTEPRPLDYFQSFVHPADRHSGQFGAALIRSGARLTREMRIVRPDGIVRWLSFKGEVVLGRDLSPDHVLGIWMDVTDLRAAAELLDQSRKRFQTLAEACGAVTWTATENGVQLSMDLEGWCSLSGQPVDAAAGGGWIELIHPQDRIRLQQTWLQCCATGNNLDTDVRLVKAGASEIWLKMRAKALRNADGRIVEWLGVIFPRPVASGAGGPGCSSASATRPIRLTSEQVRAARGLLGWSGQDLARASKVSISTIRRLEEQSGPLQVRHKLHLNIRQAFEKAGIDFTFGPDVQPGVRPR
ncbi:PAS domain-containing protein [Methylobacterium sp. A54F]